MSDLSVKALAAGSVGVYMFCLLATYRLLRNEQVRTGAPRRKIVRLYTFFMLLSLGLASLAAYVELANKAHDRASSSKVAEIQGHLRQIDSLLRSKIRYEVEQPNPNPQTLRATVADLRNAAHAAMRAVDIQPMPE